MDINNLNVVFGVAAGAVSAFGGIWAAYRHVVTSNKKKRKAEKDAILEQARSEMAKIEATLNEKIEDLETELQNQKESLSKDLSHLKEVYNAEIRVLADKIDDLRKDLSEQHSSMVALLTKLINN